MFFALFTDEVPLLKPGDFVVLSSALLGVDFELSIRVVFGTLLLPGSESPTEVAFAPFLRLPEFSVPLLPFLL